MKLLAMLGGSVLIGAAVWLSVGAEFVALWQAAWWALLVGFSFPALMGGLVLHELYWNDVRRWRERRRLPARS